MLTTASQQLFAPTRRRKSNVGQTISGGGTEMTSAVPGVGECHICFEVVPCVKLLDCNHSMCLSCLTKLLERRKSDAVGGPAAVDGKKTKITCPECRRITDCSQGAVSLKTLYFGKVRCDLCLEKKDNDDMWFCADCSMSICSKCNIKEHSKKGHKISEWNKMEPVKYSIQYITQVKSARQNCGDSDTNKAIVKSFLASIEKHLLREIQMDPEIEDIHYNLLSRYGTQYENVAATTPLSHANADCAPKVVSKVLQLAGANSTLASVPALSDQNFSLQFDISAEEVAKYLRSKVGFIPFDKDHPANRSQSNDSTDGEHDDVLDANIEEHIFVVPSIKGSIFQTAYGSDGIIALCTNEEIGLLDTKTGNVQFVSPPPKHHFRCLCFTNKPGELLAASQSTLKRHEWFLEPVFVDRIPALVLPAAPFDIDPDDRVAELKLTWCSDDNCLYEVRINESSKASEIWKATVIKKKERTKLKESLVYQKAQSKITMLQVAVCNKEHHLFVWDESAFSVLRLTIRDGRCFLSTKVNTSPTPICFVLSPRQKLWLYDPYLRRVCHSCGVAASRSSLVFKDDFCFSKLDLDSMTYTADAIIGIAINQLSIHVFRFKKEKKQTVNHPSSPKGASASKKSSLPSSPGPSSTAPKTGISQSNVPFNFRKQLQRQLS